MSNFGSLQFDPYRAMDRTQYNFSVNDASYREHCLLAYAHDDNQLYTASSKRLIKEFEETFLCDWRQERLKGFSGDYYWSNARLRFIVRSPDIPYFGLAASNRCPAIPIVYCSQFAGTEITPPRYFFNGQECSADLNFNLVRKFAEIAKARTGVLRPELELDQFLIETKLPLPTRSTN